MKKRKLLLTALLLAGTIVFIAACGDSGSGSTADTGSGSTATNTGISADDTKNDETPVADDTQNETTADADSDTVAEIPAVSQAEIDRRQGIYDSYYNDVFAGYRSVSLYYDLTQDGYDNLIVVVEKSSESMMVVCSEVRIYDINSNDEVVMVHRDAFGGANSVRLGVYEKDGKNYLFRDAFYSEGYEYALYAIDPSTVAYYDQSDAYFGVGRVVADEKQPYGGMGEVLGSAYVELERDEYEAPVYTAEYESAMAKGDSYFENCKIILMTSFFDNPLLYN